MTRVALVDDQALLRAGLRALLDAEDDLEVVGEAGDGEEAVALALARRPDVVLMDIRMPALDGLEATRRIVAEPDLAGVKVVVLTTFEVDEYVFEALRAGAAGFLLKDSDPEDIVRAVRVVAEGESLLSPSVTRRVVETFAAGAAPTAPAVGGAVVERPRRADRARGGDRGARRHRPLQRGDRRAPDHQPGHRAHPRLARDAQARRARPRAARRLRLRGRARHARPRRDVARRPTATPDCVGPEPPSARRQARPRAAASWP